MRAMAGGYGAAGYQTACTRPRASTAASSEMAYHAAQVDEWVRGGA